MVMEIHVVNPECALSLNGNAVPQRIMPRNTHRQSTKCGKHCCFLLSMTMTIIVTLVLLTVHISVNGTNASLKFGKMNKTEGSLYPPPLTGAASDIETPVWSRGSWGRFDVESSSSISGRSGAICSVYPSVSSLAVSCSGLGVNANKGNTAIYPLHFIVEHQEGIYVHDVVCVRGCKRAILVEYAVKSRRNGVVIKSPKDLSEECETNEMCILMFDFLVSPTGRNKKISALPPVCFMSIGDWGLTPNVIPIANAMNDVAKMSFSKFIISTGDNFYPFGVNNVTDPQWDRTFEKPFSGSYVKNMRWYISLGNHDNWGVKAAQVEYGKTHPRWYLPSFVYNDLVPLFDSRRASYSSKESSTSNETVKSFSSIHITTLDTFGEYLSEQVTFLEKSLEQANSVVKDVKPSGSEFVSSVWKLVLNHGPLFSGSVHGQDVSETVPIRQLLKPVIDKFEVHIYLNGHDHVLEVLHSGNTDYFVNGAGGALRMYSSKRTPETVWHQDFSDEEKFKRDSKKSRDVTGLLETKMGRILAGEADNQKETRISNSTSELPKAKNEKYLRGFMKHCVYFGDSGGKDEGQRIVTSLIKVDMKTYDVGVLYDHTTRYTSSGSRGRRKISIK